MSRVFVLLTNAVVKDINLSDNLSGQLISDNLIRWKQYLLKNQIVISVDDIYHWPALFISPYLDSADDIYDFF